MRLIRVLIRHGLVWSALMLTASFTISAVGALVIGHWLVQEGQPLLLLRVVLCFLLLLELFVGSAILPLTLVDVFPRVESLQLPHQELLLRLLVVRLVL